jgi:hypothetical protein
LCCFRRSTPRSRVWPVLLVEPPVGLVWSWSAQCGGYQPPSGPSYIAMRVHPGHCVRGVPPPISFIMLVSD